MMPTRLPGSAPTRRGLLGGIAAAAAGTALPARHTLADPGAGPTPNVAANIAALHRAAQAEGKLVYWSAEETPLARAMMARFTATYPGIEATQFRIEPASSAHRILAEHQAGQVNVDAFNMPLLFMQPILEQQLAVPVDWAGLYGADPELVMYGGRGLCCWDLEMPLCINTDLTSAGAITSWEDLLKPAWRGKVLLEARGLPLAILMRDPADGGWGEARVLEYIAKLKANDPVVLLGGSPAAEALASGRAAVAIGTYSSKIDLYRRAGGPVDWLTVGPIPAITYVMCVASGCAHPNAARLWAQWTAGAGSEAVFETTNFGLVHGRKLSPNGRKMRAAGARIVLEDSDVAANQRRLSLVAAAIGALK